MKTNQKTSGSSDRLFLIAATGCILLVIICLIAELVTPRQSLKADTEPEALLKDQAQSGSPALAAITVITETPEATDSPNLQPEIVRTADSRLSDIEVTFRMDPRFTRSLYMGDRWVSPPTFTRVGEGPECTVEVRAQGVDDQGKPIEISPQWSSADPGLATISPDEGKEVTISVHRPGQAIIEVAAMGLSKRLPLTAVAHGNTLMVQLFQPEVNRELATRSMPVQAVAALQTAQSHASVRKPDSGTRPHHRRHIPVISATSFSADSGAADAANTQSGLNEPVASLAVPESAVQPR